MELRSLLLNCLLFGFEVSKETRLKMLAEIFNLKGKKVKEEVEIVDGFEIWSMQRFDAGKDEGFVIGKEEERKQNLENIVKNLIDQSKRDGKVLTKAEALKQAKNLLA